MKQGDMINIEFLGERKVRKARKAGPCHPWATRKEHDIEPGDLYVETELAHGTNPFVMKRCCLNCLKPKSRAEDNKRLRQRRKDAGLVQFRCWCTPAQRKAFEKLLMKNERTHIRISRRGR